MQIDQRNNPKLMWMIAGGIIAIIALISVLLWLNQSSEQKPMVPINASATVATNAPTQPPVAQPIEQTTQTAPANTALVNESILKDKVPENSSLAKEEVAKLEDIQKQLDEQKSNLDSQHTDADKLIQLKEEQLKILEQQLAAQGK